MLFKIRAVSQEEIVTPNVRNDKEHRKVRHCQTRGGGRHTSKGNSEKTGQEEKVLVLGLILWGKLKKILPSLLFKFLDLTSHSLWQKETSLQIGLNTRKSHGGHK